MVDRLRAMENYTYMQANKNVNTTLCSKCTTIRNACKVYGLTTLHQQLLVCVHKLVRTVSDANRETSLNAASSYTCDSLALASLRKGRPIFIRIHPWAPSMDHDRCSPPHLKCTNYRLHLNCCCYVGDAPLVPSEQSRQLAPVDSSSSESQGK